MKSLKHLFGGVRMRLLICFAGSLIIMMLVTAYLIGHLRNILQAQQISVPPEVWTSFWPEYTLYMLLSFALVFAFVWTRLNKWIVDPITDISVAVMKMARDGNFTQELSAEDHEGEMGQLFQAISEMQNSLREITELARSISRGDLSTEIEHRNPLSEQFVHMQYSLRALAEQAKLVAEGDLTHKVRAEGDLAHSFNMMVESLDSLVQKARDSGMRISKASSRILAAAEEQASYSAEQAASVSETSATIEELATSAKQIAANAQAVVQVADATLESARDGQDAMDNVMQGMDEIRTGTESSAQRILGLGEKSQEIGGIIETIDGIADQTNLLALNAAIEAARAGDSGRSFAVVAQEIRKLAEDVVESTREITDLITEIQSTTNASVMATEDGKRRVEKGVTVAARTGDTLNQILQTVQRTTEAASQIRISTQQQQSASEQLVTTMREIAEVSKQSATSSKEAMDGASELASLADDLKTAIGQFKLGSDTRISEKK